MISHHKIVEVVDTLFPGGFTAGGSFRLQLKTLSTDNADDRRRKLRAARRGARKEVQSILAERLNVDEGDVLVPQASGAPQWPPGFVGSLAYKGTIILSAVAPSSKLTELGIDLERVQPSLDSQLSRIVGGDAPPSLDAPIGNLVAFSCKEAVFKAQFPKHRKPLEFDDVDLRWHRIDGGRISGAALVRDVGSYEIEAALHGAWVAPVAFRRASPSQNRT